MNIDSTSMAKSLLEKPLSLLTEDDIVQITREECRRFLKDRGMRRPSWNKSQAIQQVISLKALLEDRSDPDDISTAARIQRKLRSPPPQPPLTPSHVSLPSSTLEASGSGDSHSVPPAAKDPSPYRRKDAFAPPFTANDLPCLFQAAGKPQLPQPSNFPHPRTAAEGWLGQLTIFYGGTVNVFDGVPSEKAREIMQLASTRDSYDGPTVAQAPSDRPFLNRLTAAYTGSMLTGLSAGDGSYPNTPTGKLRRSFKDSLEEGRAPREPVPERSTSRKASLKRYLEKRKDRHKGRQIIEGSSSPSMELICLSQKFSGQVQNELSSRSNSSSSLQPRPSFLPHSRCTSIETKKLGISIDLNDDGDN